MDETRFISKITDWDREEVERLLTSIDRIVPQFSEAYEYIVGVAKANLYGQSVVSFYPGYIKLRPDCSVSAYNVEAAKEKYGNKRFGIIIDIDPIDLTVQTNIERTYVSFEGYDIQHFYLDSFYINDYYKIKTGQLSKLTCLSRSSLSSHLAEISIDDKVLRIMDNFCQHTEDIYRFFTSDAFREVQCNIYL